MTAPVPPLVFEPILKEKVWGGRRLARLGKALPPGTPIGESWELADLAEGRSVVAGGPHAGRTLQDLLSSHREAIMGTAAVSQEGRFPLLVKYLDAERNLSVQVHPSPEYARTHPGAHLKSEAWFIVDAEPDARIYLGLKPGLSPDRIRRDIDSGAVVDDLVAVPVAAGDCHYLPSGTCHALGAGILVAEVQTTSDTTFRLYDWGRSGREMHVEQALQCIDFDQPAPPEPPAPSAPFRRGPVTTRPLVRTEHFGMDLIEVQDIADMPIVTNGLPEAWMLLGGSARIQMPAGPPVDVLNGATVLLPASLGDGRAVVTEPARILRVTLPSPLKGLLA
jgi:mannose-6-phosphate isomerase